MGAPRNNQFWKLRTKHGRDRIIKDPKILLESALEYFKWCEENPIQVAENFNTRNGVETHFLPKRRVFQKPGLAIYLGVGTWQVINDLKNKSKDFLEVIMHIEEIIFNQKFEGASVGQFHPNIIARDLGLIDKKEIEQKTEMKPIEFTIIKNKSNGK